MVRYVPEQNLKYLPQQPDGVYLTRFTKRPGLIKVELDLGWIRKHACTYNRLMGRPKRPTL